MASSDLVPETKVLAIASHVTYGFVGNTMATFVMQSLGCDVSAINTVHFSNHTGYRQWKGTKVTAQEIRDLYQGLVQNELNDFDVLLSGYAPGAAAVEAVGTIAQDLRKKGARRPGSFFWVLDPVMGDNGRVYVSDDVIPVYKQMLPYADLILPNQFEAELLADVRILSLADLADAIAIIHKRYHVPHIVVTSVQLPLLSSSSSADSASDPDTLTVIGSTARADMTPRLFRLVVPRIDCYFSGTGDMFAALTVARLREAVFATNVTKSGETPLHETESWVSPDSVPDTELPLAKATAKVLASMHSILERTMRERDEELAAYTPETESSPERRAAEEKSVVRMSKAAEVRLVRNVDLLKRPDVEFQPMEWGKQA